MGQDIDPFRAISISMRAHDLKAEGRRVGLIEAPLYRHPTHDHRTAMHPLLWSSDA